MTFRLTRGGRVSLFLVVEFGSDARTSELTRGAFAPPVHPYPAAFNGKARIHGQAGI
jgi:hypothetical protein